MKTTLVSLFIAALLGIAFSINAAELISTLFVIGLFAWTFRQYRRPAPVPTFERPIRPPGRIAVQALNAPSHQLAA